MKIKKEALTAKPASGSESTVQNGPVNKKDHSLQTVSEMLAQKSLSVLSDSSPNNCNDQQVISVATLRSSSTGRTSTEPWHHAGILRQALLSNSFSGPMEKPESTISKSSELPKISDSLLPSVDDMKLNEVLPPVSESLSNNSLSHASFPTGTSFSAPISSLPSVTTPFGTLTFAPTTRTSLSCSVPTQDEASALPLMSQLETCDISQSGLHGSSSTVSPSSAADTVSNGDASSSESVSVSNISTSLVSVDSSYTSPNLCQAIASLSSKDDAVTVVYSSIPKIEPQASHLMHNIQKTVPLPSMSEVKSSLTNHLNALPQTQNKSSESDIHAKLSVALPNISSAKSNSHETLEFRSIPANEVVDTMNIKLDGSSDSSEFGSNSTVSLPAGSVKFTSDSSSSDLGSSIVIPVSSDVILTKIDGQNSVSSQDISHIITIPLPTGTVYNTSLSIPMPLPLCNGNVTDSSSQMTAAVVPSMLYSISGISNQVSNSCWPASATTLSVTSNSHQATSVTTSLPVSIMSVTSTMPSVTGSNMIHLTSNSISTPTSSHVASTVPHQDPVCYTVQSPAEILSQLSKAGALPAMSSSQVSSVLSALASDTSVDMDTDNAHHNEILNGQELHVDKVSTLTQTDTLEMNIMQNDEKIIQMLEQVSSTQVMVPPGSSHPEIQNSPAEASHLAPNLNGSELMTADITEVKQVPGPFPRIVAMVLNPSAVGGEKISVPDVHDAVFKDNDIRIANSLVQQSLEQRPENTDDSIHDFLVLPSNAKAQRKRSKRTSALREMLLGPVESSVDKEHQSKKPRGRPKRAKSDSVGNASVSDVKNDTGKVEETCWDKNDRTSCFTKEAGCYKCIYCPFISLEENNMVVHVKLKHSSEVSDVSIVRQELKCPGCPNVFFTTNSLEVHLKQDHQVNTPELKAIMNSVIKIAVEGKMKEIQQTSTAKQKKKPEQKKNLNNGEAKDMDTISAPRSTLPEVLTSNTNNAPEIEPTRSLIVNHPPDACEGIANEANKVRVRNLSNNIEVSDEHICQKNNTVDGISENAEKDVHSALAEPNGSAVSMELMTASPAKPVTDTSTSRKKQPEEQKRKRGRPKGSKSSTVVAAARGMGKDQGPKKSSGHRCNIDNCAVTMRSPENIEYHRSCHNGTEFRCPECSHTHCHWDGMSIHLWRAHMVDMELYTCDQCNYKTNSYAKLINLHKWIHGSERPFLCDSCGKGFKNPKQLRNHKAVHQPKQTKVGECEVCGRSFTNKRLLRMHLDNVHNKLRPHLCNYCGYSASSVSSLKMHMRKHTGEKPFRCQLCDYCTADHNSLRRHKMRHTGDKPYKCPHCTYACIQSSTYKAHLKTKHPGMDDGLMFSCNLCSFRSVKEENYIAHLSEHKRDVISVTEKQSDSDTQALAGGKQIEEFPVIVNISSQMSSFSNTDVAEDGFDLGVQSDSVIHLVVSDHHSEHYSVVKLDNIDSTPDVQMALESDFEGEEITGDISEAELITGDINEPQEFKLCESKLKMKSHEDSAIL